MLQPREEFISRLLAMLKSSLSSSSPAKNTTSATEDFESWEDRLSDEVLTSVRNRVDFYLLSPPSERSEHWRRLRDWSFCPSVCLHVL